MNKIIHECAVTALGKCWTFHPLRERKTTEFTDEQVTTFAELIVKECLDICEAQRATYTKLCKDAMDFRDKNLYAEGEITAHRIRLSIQKQFGVENE